MPVTFSLSTRTPQPTAGESAIKDLLRLVRNPRPESDPRNPKFKNSPAFQARTPTFLSGGLPRDRRGRVALKGKNPPDLTSIHGLGFGSSEDPYRDDTPRIGGGPASYAVDLEREREREFLEALRLVICSRWPQVQSNQYVLIIFFLSTEVLILSQELVLPPEDGV